MRLFVFILLLIASPAFAQQSRANIEQRLTREQMRATGLDTLSAEQLALLNRLLREEPATPVRPQAVAPPAPDGNDAMIGFSDGPVRSRLTGDIAGWEPGTVFELANGQQWKVMKGAVKLPKPVREAEVEVKPGVAGRWFLKLGDQPMPRVYRVR